MDTLSSYQATVITTHADAPEIKSDDISSKPIIAAESLDNVAMKTICFHCHDPIPAFSYISVEIDNVMQAMCCHGCKAAAQWINSAGLTEFYQHRQRSGVGGWFANAARPTKESVLKAENSWQFIDEEPAFSRYVSRNADKSLEMTLLVQGLYCSSCSWLIEKALHQYNDNIQVSIDLDAKHLHVRLPAVSQPSTVLAVISRLGYQPELLTLETTVTQLERYQQQEKRDFLRRIVVASFGMMQVMTYAVATYLGDYYQNMNGITVNSSAYLSSHHGMASSQRDFFMLTSLLVATWVVFYAGKPFFQNAWNDLKNRHLGMDVPIALAISVAYFPSVYQTLWGSAQHVYFDSAVMFVFFLQLGRFLEIRARHRLSDTPATLIRLLPSEITVQRQSVNKVDDKLSMTISPQQVQRHDQLSIAADAVVPFDARVIQGQADIDESLLSGESRAVSKQSGDNVIAGSRVLCGKLRIDASHDWHHSSIAQIERLLQQGRQLKQEQMPFHQLSRWFVVIVLMLTLLVAIGWCFVESQRVMEIVLAMLIASCPCAFALATPVSSTAASYALRRIGVLLCNIKALHCLPSITHWCFDKTGTLTQGKPRILSVNVRSGHHAEDCLQIMASLEQHSQHVVAHAFAQIDTRHSAQQVNEVIGKGLSGKINQQTYYLGKRSWISRKIRSLKEDCESIPDVDVLHESSAEDENYSEIVLADANGWLASVWIDDEVRIGALEYLHFLQQQNGGRSSILSGDRQSVVTALANQLGIQQGLGELSPEQKVQQLKILQQVGAKVAMVGDGVNDAPVLRHADVSVALATGSELSQAQADIILLNGRLDRLTQLHRVANFTQRITRQNLCWALGYNALVLPLAASGLLTPWLAAIGMSLSSLLVVLNALRINGLTESRSY